MTSLDLHFHLRRGSAAQSHDLIIDQSLPLDGLTAIFGPSGAGKTSLLRAIAGFAPTGGRITMAGEMWEDGARHLPPHRRRAGFVTQSPALFPHLDVAGNLAYAARRSGATTDVAADVAATARRFGLGPLLHRRPAGLSGGEAQRVALARAVLARPRLLLMDEPLSALDAGRRDEILPLIEALRDEARLPILYVSHALPEVARLASRTLLLNEGRVLAFGPTPAVFAENTGTGQPNLIEATCLGTDPDGLTRLALPGATLLVPGMTAHPGTRLRLLIDPRDVMIATTRPTGLSALNILPAEILTLTEADATTTDVTLLAGGVTIRARLTRRSAAMLGLSPGLGCHAVLKSVALARG